MCWWKKVARVYIHTSNVKKEASRTSALLLFNDLHGVFANFILAAVCHVRLQHQYNISSNEKSVVRELLWSRLGARDFPPILLCKHEVIARWARAADAFYRSFMQILQT